LVNPVAFPKHRVPTWNISANLYSVPSYKTWLEGYRIKEESPHGKEKNTIKEKGTGKEKGPDQEKDPGEEKARNKIYWSGY
jgi:hypothetical protein